MAAHPTEGKKGEEAAAPAAATGGGGIKAFLPLILTVLLMPALAYAMTTFVLLPKMQKAMNGGATGGEGSGEGHDGGAAHEGGASAKPKNKVPLSKIIVNVSGSGGTRLLLASLTLAGSINDFKAKIDENSDELRDLAASALASKTIADLERPESRNQIRSELLSQFNSALGQGVVQEIYITELAIQ